MAGAPCGRVDPAEARRPLGLMLGAGAFVILLGATLHRCTRHSALNGAERVGACPLEYVPARRRYRRKSGRLHHRTLQFLLQHVQRLLGRCQRVARAANVEEWCADFAAWAWHEAGVPFTYGYGQGEINGGASFYEWGSPTANGTRRRADTSLRPGMWLSTVPRSGQTRRPPTLRSSPATARPIGSDVVNGDGDRTGFSVVETGTRQALADAGNGDSILAGYVSPP